MTYIAVVTLCAQLTRDLLAIAEFLACDCAALKFYRKTDSVDSDVEEMDTEDRSSAASAADEDADTQPYTLLQLLTAADLRRPLFIACMLQVIQQFSGINAVSIYTAVSYVGSFRRGRGHRPQNVSLAPRFFYLIYDDVHSVL